MNNISQTAQRLVDSAVALFSQRGYDGTSVRAITAHAEANLGAITYHFGSKEALYDAALQSVTKPILELAAGMTTCDDPPLLRIERLVGLFFSHLSEHPEFPNLISHQLAGSRPLPKSARDVMQKNIAILTSLITAGQRDGTIRSGNPRDMALSVVAQPMWLTLARRVLSEGEVVDQSDPETRERLANSVVQFVRAGLRTSPEDPK